MRRPIRYLLSALSALLTIVALLISGSQQAQAQTKLTLPTVNKCNPYHAEVYLKVWTHHEILGNQIYWPLGHGIVSDCSATKHSFKILADVSPHHARGSVVISVDPKTGMCSLFADLDLTLVDGNDIHTFNAKIFSVDPNTKQQVPVQVRCYNVASLEYYGMNHGDIGDNNNGKVVDIPGKSVCIPPEFPVQCVQATPQLPVRVLYYPTGDNVFQLRWVKSEWNFKTNHSSIDYDIIQFDVR